MAGISSSVATAAALERALRDDTKRAHFDLRILTSTLSADGVDVKFSFSGHTSKPLDVVAVLTDDADRSNVLRGENSGRLLQHVSVARSLTKVATVAGDMRNPSIYRFRRAFKWLPVRATISSFSYRKRFRGRFWELPRVSLRSTYADRVTFPAFLCLMNNFAGSAHMQVYSFNPFQKLFRVFVALSALFLATAVFAETPAVGTKAPDFALSTPTGKTVKMSKELHGHNLVLVVLRGFPGYQCPYCVKQVHDFVEHAADFAAKNVNVLLVYPGPPADLDHMQKTFLRCSRSCPPISSSPSIRITP